jgi:Na+/melibiose symporter-like transporter
MYYLPVYYESVKGLSTVKSGLAVLPETLTITPASIAIGFLISWLGKYRWAIWSGWGLSVAGCGMLYVLDETTPIAKWIGLNITAGIGMGFLFGALGFPIQASVDAKKVPLAVTLFSFWRAFGAVSLFTEIFK